MNVQSRHAAELACSSGTSVRGRRGVQIMDIAILVVDATKGIQPQTAECLILAELLSSCIIVALNKTDLFPADARAKQTRRVGKAVLGTLRLTRFAGSEIVPVAAKPEPVGMAELREALLAALPRTQLRREAGEPLLFMADHCFPVKGHGTVLSGARSLHLQRPPCESQQPRCDAHAAHAHDCSATACLAPVCAHAGVRLCAPRGAAGAPVPDGCGAAVATGNMIASCRHGAARRHKSGRQSRAAQPAAELQGEEHAELQA